jgi:hypothetical protein
VFFVDKDLDDILGVPWPSDPRIHVTDFYAVENYLVCKEVVRRFFLDFVKVRKVEFDLEILLPEFDLQLKAFHRAILPLMAWVVTMRRTGRHPVLNDISPGDFLAFRDSRVARRGRVRILRHLERVAQVNFHPGEWRQVRQTFRELHRLQPKRYVRGKFEAWFLLGFIRKTEESLRVMAQESGGAVSVSVQLTDSNFIQLLVRALPIPHTLSSFLEFHLKHEVAPQNSRRTGGIRERVRSWFRRQQ